MYNVILADLKVNVTSIKNLEDSPVDRLRV